MSRGSKLFVGGIVLVGGIVAGAYVILLGSDAPAPTSLPEAAAPLAAAPVAAPPAPAALALAEGSLEVEKAGGVWEQLAVGGRIAPGSQLRTADAGAALSLGSDLRIELKSATQVRIGEMNERFAKLVVGEGLVFADVAPTFGRALQVTGNDGKAVAETRDGALFVSASRDGKVQAAVTRGEAALSAEGTTVTLRSGFYSIAGGGIKPTTPAPVPASLLLKVRWPEETETAKPKQLIRGTTAPGARVRIGDQYVWADSNGRFATVVDLREGKNRIQVQAVDVLGHEQRASSPEIELDTRAPSHAIETSPEMWKTTTDGKAKTP